MIKVAFFDLDGTLLNREHRVFPQSIEALRKLQNHGVRVVISTGRPPIMGYYIQHLLGSPIDFIGCAGSVSIINQQLHQSIITHQETLEILELTKQYHPQITVALKNVDGMWISRYSHLLRYEDINALLPDHKQINVQITPDLLETVRAQKLQAWKILFFNEDRSQTAMQEISQVLAHLPIHITSSGTFNLEINPLNTNKGTAVTHYLQTLNIQPSEACAIGDSDNDYSMMLVCHERIAMENANERLQALATYQAKHHNDPQAITDIVEYIIRQNQNENKNTSN